MIDQDAAFVLRLSRFIRHKSCCTFLLRHNPHNILMDFILKKDTPIGCYTARSNPRLGFLDIYRLTCPKKLVFLDICLIMWIEVSLFWTYQVVHLSVIP